MPKFDGQAIAIDLTEFPEVKGVKRAVYTVTDKATGHVSVVQFYGAVVPDFSDPAVQAKEAAAHFPADPCATEIKAAVETALGMVAAGVPPQQALAAVAPETAPAQPSMMQRARAWVGLSIAFVMLSASLAIATEKVVCPAPLIVAQSASSNAPTVQHLDCAPAIQAAINAASIDEVVIMPDGTWLVESPIVVNKRIWLRGGGTGTVLWHKKNISLAGKGAIVFVSGAGAKLSMFTVAADPSLVNGLPTFRTSGIMVTGGASDITIENVRFKNITSTAILLSGDNINDISIVGCDVEEYFEQFVEIAATGNNILIAGNHAHATYGHPVLGSIEPFPIALTPGLSTTGGLLSNVIVKDNTFSVMGMNSNERVNSRGVRLATDGYTKLSFAYDQIHISGNTFIGMARGVDIVMMQNKMPSNGIVTITGNHFLEHILEPIVINTQGVGLVTINDNFIHLRESFPPYSFTTNIPVQLSGNICYQWPKPQRECN